MAEGLKLVVTADVTQAEKVVKDFVSDTVTAGQTAGAGFAKGFNKSVPIIENIAPKAKAATKAISSLGDSIETLEAKLGAKKEFLRVAKTTTDISFLKDEIRQLEGEIKRVKGVGDLTFNGLSTTALKSSNAFSKVVQGANSAFGAIRKIAFILPGIGIAGIFGALFSVFSSGADDAEKSVKKVSSATDEANKKAEELAKAFDKAAASVIGEADKIKELRDILLSTKDATVALTQATINQGLARFLFDEKNTQLQNILNAGIQKELALRKAAKPFSTVGEFRDNSAQIEQLDQEIKRRQQLGLSVKDLIDKKKNLNNIQGLEFGAQDELSNINELSDGLEGFFKKFLDGSDKTKKATDDVIAQAKRLAAFLNKNTQFQVNFEVDETASEAQQKQAAREFIAKTREFFQRNSSALGTFEFKPLVRVQFNFIQDKAKFIRDVTTETTKTYAEAKKAFEENIKRLATTNPLIIETNAKIKAAIEREGLRNKSNNDLFKSLGGGLFNLPENPKDSQGNEIFSKIEQQSREAAAAINQTLAPAFDSLFAAIKAGENPLQAFFKGLAQSIEQLIQKIIQAAIEAAILSAILPGGVGGVKGFGSIFKSILGFAGGGIVSGPTLGLIGEGIGTNKSNPEVVAPLDQLKGLLSGLAPAPAAGNSIAGVIRGQNIKLINKRTDRRDRRLGAGG